MKKVFSLTFIMLLFASVSVFGQDIAGKWKTIDDKTGEAKSIVTISESGGVYTGVVSELLLRKDDPVCEKCKGDKKDQKVTGLQIIENMKTGKDGVLSGGKILDPENGKEYKCKMWLEDGNLKVRGYIGFLFRTQTWYKAD